MKSSGPEHVRRLASKGVSFLELWNIVLAKSNWLSALTLRKPSNASPLPVHCKHAFALESLPLPWTFSADTFFSWEGEGCSWWSRKVSRWLAPDEEASVCAPRCSRSTAPAGNLQKSRWWKGWIQGALKRGQDSEVFLEQEGLRASCQLVLFQLILLESKLARENGKAHLRDKSTSVPRSCFNCFALWSALGRDCIAMTYCCSSGRKDEVCPRALTFHLGGLS